ncbi:TP901 family phage tail tape measure protein [Catenulispora sp. GAS73]|uniref:phage tail tape measure protein n=1 Tax=Catenulispora sp. GAS73 TaxID=3156269 RepID=UPI0035197C04
MALPKLFLEVVGVGGSVNSMLRGMGRDIEAATATGTTSLGRLKNVGTAALLGLSEGAVMVGAKTVSMAGNFQAGMTSLETGAGELHSNLKLVSSGVLDMTGQVGESTKSLTDGLYMIESAGYHGADGLTVLKNSAEGAKVGNADLETIADAVTTSLNAYHEKASDSATVTNELIATVANGKTHMEDLAGSLATVVPAASAAHLSLEQVLGAMATETGEGTKAADAATYLKQTIAQLSNPTGKAAQEMKGLGLSATDISEHLGQRGLTGTLQLLTDAIDRKMGPSGTVVIETLAKASKNTTEYQKALANLSPAQQTYIGALADMVGGSKSMQAALELSGANMATFKGNVDAVSTAAKNGAGQITGWAQVQQTYNQRLSEAKGQVEALGIRIGSGLLPWVSRAVGWFSTSVTWLTKHKTAGEAVAVVVGGVMVTALAAYAVKGAISVGTTIANTGALVANKAASIASAVATRALTAATWLLDAAMDANPIMLVVLALVAIGVALYEAYQHSTTFRQIIQAAFREVGKIALWLWHEVFEPAFRGIAAVTMWLYNNGIRPTFRLVSAAVRDTGAVLVWLWHSVAEPVFRGIGAVLAFWWNDFAWPIIKIHIAMLRLTAAVLLWLWRDVAEPVFRGIGAVVTWWWNSIVKPSFNLVVAIIRTTGAVLTWLWRNAAEPAFHGIAVAASFLYDHGVKPTLGLIKTIVTDTGNVLLWLWHNVAEPVFSGIGTALSFAWNHVMKPVFDTMKRVIDDVGGAISKVGGAFKSISGAVSGGLNSVSSLLGFDDGGPVPGAPGAPMLAVVHGGEYVLSRDMLAGRAGAGGSGPVPVSAGSGAGGIVINVQGSVLTDRDLASTMQRVMLQQGARFSTSYTPFHR